MRHQCRFWSWCVFLVSWALVSQPSVLQVSPVNPGKKCWQVSNLGRCRNSRGIITEGSRHASGYRRIQIAGHHFAVHRCVLWEFDGPPPREAMSEVNHIDGNRSNNMVQNLEWVSSSENTRHSYENILRCKRARPVRVRPVGSRKWTQYASITSAADKLGQPRSTLRRQCERNAQVHGLEYAFVNREVHQPVPTDSPEEVWLPLIDPQSGATVEAMMVSSRARIRFKTGGISCGSCRRDRYMEFGIKVMGRWRKTLVHRVVARAFLGPPPSPAHTQVNHKDMNRSNNAVENLEYATPAQNMRHYYSNRKGRHHCSTPVLSRVYGSSGDWKRHASFKDAAKTLRVWPQCISACIRRFRKQTGGYEFRLAEPDVAVADTLPGEEWRDVNLEAHLQDRKRRQERLQSRRAERPSQT